MLTLFVGGNHESSGYLAELPNGGWVAPNIYYMGYASVSYFIFLWISFFYALHTISRTLSRPVASGPSSISEKTKRGDPYHLIFFSFSLTPETAAHLPKNFFPSYGPGFENMLYIVHSSLSSQKIPFIIAKRISKCFQRTEFLLHQFLRLSQFFIGYLP